MCSVTVYVVYLIWPL